MDKLQSVGLWLREDKDRDRCVSGRVASLLAERGIACLGVAGQHTGGIPGVREVEPEEIAREARCMIVLGGDGTMLAAARACAPLGLPLLGVNLGHKGFLTEVEPDDVADAVARLAEGAFSVEERMMLRADVIRMGEAEESYIALNDVTLTRREPVKMLRTAAYLDGSLVDRYQADAVLVATPTGSTAYNLAAGGPLLSPDADALILNPVCAHSFTGRPVVAGGRSRVCFRPEEAHHVLLTLDGQQRIRLREGDAVEVCKSQEVTRLIRFAPHNVFAVLRRKFMNPSEDV